MSANAIVFESVDFRYRSAPVLEKISFTLPLCETACIVGPNGGGKSTLLKLALGLLTPDSGRIEILGSEPRESRRRVGYMPQHVHLDPQFPITVREIVMAGRLQGNRIGFYSKKDRRVVDRVMEEIEVDRFANDRFHDLSGGQKQRVLIARALAVDPEILLLDEPTAMADAHLEARILERIRALHRQLTIVLVSHDAAFVANLVGRVFCVNRSLWEHPVTSLDGEVLHQLYGHEVRMVRHDGDEGGCRHD